MVSDRDGFVMVASSTAGTRAALENFVDNFYAQFHI